MALVIPFLLSLSNQNHHLDTDQSLCPLKMLTGFPCPSCGITKSMVYCYEGNFAKSLQYHVLGPFAILFCVFMIILLWVEIITQKNYFQNYFYNKKIAYSLAVFLMLYHSYRLIIYIITHSWDEIVRESIWK